MMNFIIDLDTNYFLLILLGMVVAFFLVVLAVFKGEL